MCSMMTTSVNNECYVVALLKTPGEDVLKLISKVMKSDITSIPIIDG